MSGMGSSLQLTNQTVVAAFRSALIHQGIIALLIFFLLAMLWVSVREWLPAARQRPGLSPAARAAEPAGRRLIRIGFGDVALLQAGTCRAASLLDAWSTGNGAGWQLSAPYPLAGAQPRSAALAGRALGVLLRGAHGTTGRAVTVAGPGAAWQAMPALPAGTAALPAEAATLAAGPASGFQLLTARLSKMSVWSASASGWTRSQVIKVSIPYGSSG